MGCGCCSVRCWLIVALTLTLLFTAIRQGLDSWGRLYLCIIMNFLHILMTVVGLFGVGQLRTKLLLVFLIWWPFWLTWNSFVFSYYQNFGILSRDSKILSLGEGETLTDVDPKVDGIGSRWLWILVQLKVGFRKYWWIEVGFAVLQIALSLICGLLALIFLLKRRNKRVESPDISRRNSNQPRITLQLADVNFRPSVATTASTNNGYTSDTTGYLNASFDDSPSGYHTRNGKLPDSFNMGSTQDSQQNGTAVGPNYRRSNSERTRSRNGTESSRSKRHHNGVDRPNDTLMLARSQDDQQTPVKVRHNSLEKETKRKSTKDRRNSYSGRSKGRPESTGETTSMNKTGDLALVIDDQRQQSHRKKSDGDDLRRSSRSNENSRRSSSHRKTRKSEESVTGSSRQQQQSSSFRHIPTGNLQRLSHPGAESSGSDVPADSPVSR